MAYAIHDASASSLWGNIQNVAKDALNTYGPQGKAAAVAGLQKGVSSFVQTRNFDDLKSNFISGAEEGFSQANLKKQVDQLILKFFDDQETPSTTIAQKQAIQNLYNKQQYQQIINVINLTNDIYHMLNQASDEVKNVHQITLAQMGEAIQNVNEGNILIVTQKIHDFVGGIVGAASAQVQSSSLDREDVEKITKEFVENNYGPLLQWVQGQMEREKLQEKAPTNNPFLLNNAGANNSTSGQKNNPFISNQSTKQATNVTNTANKKQS